MKRQGPPKKPLDLGDDKDPGVHWESAEFGDADHLLPVIPSWSDGYSQAAVQLHS